MAQVLPEGVRVLKEDPGPLGVASLFPTGGPVRGTSLFKPEEVQFCAPVPRPPKIICVGLNYRDHAAETNQPLPKTPVLFNKYARAVIGPQEPIVLPQVSEQVDYEAELVVVIGREGKHIPEELAMEYVAGYTILNDVSARDLQMESGQWMKGKTCDTFAPMGPWLVTKDEIPDPHGLKIGLRLNGQVMQAGHTGEMIFKIPRLISYLSHLFTLEVGDIIATGTPAGVGFTRQPPVFLRAGDVVEVEIEGIGVLTNPVRKEA